MNAAMTTKKIKLMLNTIAASGSGIVYTDIGSGCGGPGFLDSDFLRDLILDGGQFDDAVMGDLDLDLARDSFEHQCEFDDDTDWVQIEYAFGDNGYHQIAWIWSV